MRINLLTLCTAVLIISACDKKSPNEEVSNQLSPAAKLSNTGSFNVNSAVPADSARAWVNNYGNWLKSQNLQYTSQTMPDGSTTQVANSRTVWFSVEQMENMVNKIKAAGGDGIRFYFARYNSQPSFVNTCTGEELNYSGMNTLLMVPTRQDDCFHRDITDSPGVLEATSPIENRGEICPPPANCNSVGATLLDSLSN